MLKNRPSSRNPHHRSAIFCLTLALLCVFAQQAPAQSSASPQDRWYDVELLIFKYSNPEEFSAENRPERWSLPDTKNSVNLESIDAAQRDNFQIQDPKTRSFGGMLEKLDKSTRYEVLNYSAWRQRGLGRDEAVGVRIRAGRAYLPQAPVPADAEFGLFEEGFVEQGFLPEVTIRRYNETQSKTGNILYELEGEVKIVLSRFLHVYADLLLLKPVTLTPVEPAPQTRNSNAHGSGHGPLAAYRIDWSQQAQAAGPGMPLSGADETLYGINIKAHRRMRSGELHHIDHPLLGMLIQIKPVENKP